MTSFKVFDKPRLTKFDKPRLTKIERVWKCAGAVVKVRNWTTTSSDFCVAYGVSPKDAYCRWVDLTGMNRRA